MTLWNEHIRRVLFLWALRAKDWKHAEGEHGRHNDEISGFKLRFAVKKEYFCFLPAILWRAGLKRKRNAGKPGDAKRHAP